MLNDRTSRQPETGSAAVAGLDLDRLTQYLHSAAPGLVEGPLRATLITGGRSNLTYELSDSSRTWILRRPPLGHVLATAHDMSREYRVLTALAATDVPAPETLLNCGDAAILGAPFYLMERIEGLVPRTTDDVAQLSAAQGKALSGALVDVLADLHAVDPDAVGLGDFGHPEGFLARQVRRWSKQLAGSRSRTIPGVEALAERLAATVPDSARTSIVHGDYKLDNTIVDARAPEHIVGVLDWEMSTLGDPLADLGLLLLYWERGDRFGDNTTVRTSACPGFLTADELVQRYARRCGHPLENLAWYRALGCYKLAVISEGIYYRYTKGLTVGDGFTNSGALVFGLVDRAHEILDRA